MRAGFDFKSVVFVAFGLALGLALGIGISSNRQGTNRFQITANPQHAYVLDTQTGQVWERFSPSNGGHNTAGFDEPKLTSPTKID